MATSGNIYTAYEMFEKAGVESVIGFQSWYLYDNSLSLVTKLDVLAI